MDNFGKAILQGGRYDQLTQNFGTYKPACGFGININYLVDIVSVSKSKDSVSCYTDYLILYETNNRRWAFEIGQKLRTKGYIVETDRLRNIDDQIKQAKQRNIRDILKVENHEILIDRKSVVLGNSVDLGGGRLI